MEKEPAAAAAATLLFYFSSALSPLLPSSLPSCSLLVSSAVRLSSGPSTRRLRFFFPPSYAFLLARASRSSFVRELSLK